MDLRRGLFMGIPKLNVSLAPSFSHEHFKYFYPWLLPYRPQKTVDSIMFEQLVDAVNGLNIEPSD
jgi:hypothetical protein